MHCVFTDSVLDSNIYESNMFIQMYHIIEFCPKSLLAQFFSLNLGLVISYAVVVTLPVNAAHMGKYSL